MQQQYGPVLANKTPDVRETNLGVQGHVHRLLVGPPGSRSQASQLCTELKAAGYKDCWVTLTKPSLSNPSWAPSSARR